MLPSHCIRLGKKFKGTNNWSFRIVTVLFVDGSRVLKIERLEQKYERNEIVRYWKTCDVV